MAKMSKRDEGFTQGVGCLIHYISHERPQMAAYLYQNMNIPLSDYEAVCDEIDLPAIRAAAAEE